MSFFSPAGLKPAPTLFLLVILLALFTPRVEAFGAGSKCHLPLQQQQQQVNISNLFTFPPTDIASISKVEGKNWRHGDIEDMLQTLAFIKGHKWTSNMIKRVYFGNWLRDYSQALDVGTLQKVQADTIRILVWVLSFMAFGYATAEYEVTHERLGVYRPEEHIEYGFGFIY